jgi:hypothetical protein
MLSVMISGPRHREPAHYTSGPSAASLGSPPRPSAQLAAWKALIEEEFGDGIMSAIDFDMAIERLPNPKGGPVDHDVGQVPAVQVLRQCRRRTGVWVSGRSNREK